MCISLEEAAFQGAHSRRLHHTAGMKCWAQAGHCGSRLRHRWCFQSQQSRGVCAAELLSQPQTQASTICQTCGGLLVTKKVVISLTSDVDCACYVFASRCLPSTPTMVHCCRTVLGSVHSSPLSQLSLRQPLQHIDGLELDDEGVLRIKLCWGCVVTPLCRPQAGPSLPQARCCHCAMCHGELIGCEGHQAPPSCRLLPALC